MVKNILFYVCFLIPSMSFGQAISEEKVLEAMNKWVSVSTGNPIDGFNRTAFRVDKKEGKNFFILSIKNRAEWKSNSSETIIFKWLKYL